MATQTDIEKNFERRMALLRAQIMLVSVGEIALRKTLPPCDFLLGMEIPLEVV